VRPDLVRRAARPAARVVGRTVARRWPPYTRLFLAGEGAGWSIDEDVRTVGSIASRLGIRLAHPVPLGSAERQAVFFGSHFTLFQRLPVGHGHRVATTYFHGRPGTPGMPEFDEAYRELRAQHRSLHRVQVTHRELEEIVLESGIDPVKVYRIPIGVDLAHFTPQTPELREAARARLGLPQAAFVVGSFQKDGVGWDEGAEPKLIKGPDVLVDALAALKPRVADLHVLLSGPARGYVRRGLEAHGIPYVHRVLGRYGDIGGLFEALDAYVVPARQEGGPKGVLEAMAAGVPLVSTRVGQAPDLVRDGVNGLLVDVEDVDGIAHALERVASGAVDREALVTAGLATAGANTYEAQLPLWRAFFAGFVEPA
jgi:glycosyltransferase involved in cell wall biosynthesis